MKTNLQLLMAQYVAVGDGRFGSLAGIGLRACSSAEVEALPKPQLIANYIAQNL